MNTKALLLILLLFPSLFLFSQNIGINEDGSTADPSALLDIKATNKGLLLPRLTNAQMLNIDSPAEGLMIYNLDMGCMYFYNGSNQWQALCDGREYIAAAPVADFSTENFTVATDSCIDFLDITSMGIPTSWSWTFEGGSPATSSAQNPSQICFNTVGEYDVTLEVSNFFGTDSKTYQLTVTDCAITVACPTTLAIGDAYAGGVVFELEVGAGGCQQGKVVSLVNLSNSAKWQDPKSVLGGTNDDDGWENTQIIINAAGNDPTHAAQLCVDYDGGCFTDWYLPASNELSAIDDNITTVNTGLQNAGGDRISTASNVTSEFWSSTEYSSLAWRWRFANNMRYSSTKTTGYNVRAIRTF